MSTYHHIVSDVVDLFHWGYMHDILQNIFNNLAWALESGVICDLKKKIKGLSLTPVMNKETNKYANSTIHKKHFFI